MSFYTWLLQQAYRSDPVGSFAVDSARLLNFPKHADRWIEIRRFMMSRQSSMASINAALEAWTEYTAEMEE